MISRAAPLLIALTLRVRIGGPRRGAAWLALHTVEGLQTLSLAGVSATRSRILLLTHVKELIEQNVDKLAQLCPEAPSVPTRPR